MKAEAMKRIVQKVAADMGDGATTERLFAQKTAFAQLVRTQPPPRLSLAHRLPLAATLSVAAAAIAVLAIVFWPGAESLPFQVGQPHVQGVVGHWEITAPKTETYFSFEQGSHVAIRPDAKARVARADDERVEVELAAGAIEADIVGNGKTRWVVNAGPWTVTVLGTRFTVDWQPNSHLLDVKVFRGKVLVQEQKNRDHGITVKGGDHFRANATQRAVFPLESSDVAPETPGEETSSLFHNILSGSNTLADGGLATETGAETLKPTEAPASQSTSVMPKAPSMAAAQYNDEHTPSATQGATHSGKDDVAAPSTSTGDEARTRWLIHYASGDYARALGIASAYGIDRLIKELDAVALWKLQDAARVSKNYQLSAKILQRFRQRFSQNKNARIAGFLLGRIAMDKQQYGTAANWFNTYISEDPSGPLAEEAHGLLIVVYEKSGQAKAARSAAQNYLKKYQSGAFARIARSKLEAPAKQAAGNR